jgi:excinuclease ABC subunit C
MKDLAGKVLYVGKAKNLKKRVTSYFYTAKIHSPKITQLVKVVRTVDFIVTSTEKEALVLENNSIKKYQPRYNTRLKDNKNYPYLKINLAESFPRVIKTRKKGKDKAKYFGPYTSMKQLQYLLDLINEYFGLIRCKSIKGITEPCLYYHINRCSAPCIGKISKNDYGEGISDVILLLEGSYDHLLGELEQKMQQASNLLEFEEAAYYKHKIDSINDLKERQKVDQVNSHRNYDYFVSASFMDTNLMQVFRIKEGHLVQNYCYDLAVGDGDDRQDSLSQGILQFYADHLDFPHEVVVEDLLEDPDLISFMKDRKVSLHQTKKGDKKELMNMLRQNVYFSLKRQLHVSGEINYVEIQKRLKDSLHLKKAPQSIIGIDISHLGGTNIVASKVHFQEGIPHKNYYRRFNIKTVLDNDDYASIYEVVYRLFSKFKKSERPDLVLIDGGIGQLRAALKALSACHVKGQEILSLAKKEEIIYLPYQEDGVRLDKDHSGLKLLQRVRDESHRFAIGFQRSKRHL